MTRAEAAGRYRNARAALEHAKDFAEGFPGDVSFGWVREALDEYEDSAAIAAEWCVAGAFTSDFKEVRP
jgi:hypothetical protein